jgi:formate dehydrogenase iron-sulfur subunit
MGAAIVRAIWGSRVAAALLFNGVFPAMVLAGALPGKARWFIAAGVLLGELRERYLFCRAVDAPKMPGLPAAVADKREVPK